jgi:hypothetical protein
MEVEGVNQKFAKFAQDYVEGMRRTHVLVGMLRIGPWRMQSFPNHAAYNAAYITVLAIVMTIILTVYTPDGVDYGIVVGFVVALLSIYLVGVVGYFISLFSVLPEAADVDVPEQYVRERTDKWVTYCCTVFFLAAVCYLLFNLTCETISGNSLSSALTRMLGVGFSTGLSITVGATSLVSSAIVFGAMWKTGRLLDTGLTAIWCMVVGFGISFGAMMALFSVFTA